MTLIHISNKKWQQPDGKWRAGHPYCYVEKDTEAECDDYLLRDNHRYALALLKPVDPKPFRCKQGWHNWRCLTMDAGQRGDLTSQHCIRCNRFIYDVGYANEVLVP